MKIKKFLRTIGVLLMPLVSSGIFYAKQVKAEGTNYKVSELKEYSSNISGTLVFSGSGKYRLSAIGNSNEIGTTYPQMDSSFRAGTEVDVDLDPTTHNSTSMSYVPYNKHSKIVKAFLNINAFPSSGISTKDAYIEGPKGGKIIFDKNGLGKSYDITKFVQEEGAGDYWGKNLPVAVGSPSSDIFSNWEIVYVEEDSTMPSNRNTVLYYNGVRQSGNISLDIDGKLIGISDYGVPDVGLLLTVDGGEDSKAWNGNYKEHLAIQAIKDESPTRKDSMYSDAIRPADDVLNEKISINGKIPEKINPKYPYANKDILVNQNLNKDYFLDGKQSIRLSLALTGGLVTPNFYGLTVSLESPSVIIDAHDKENKSKSMAIYDKKVVETTLKMENDISLIHSTMIIDLPDGLNCDSSTIKLDGKAVAEATYDEQTSQIKIPIKEKIPDSMILEYEVNVDKKKQFHEGPIKTSIKGKAVYPNGDIASDYVSKEDSLDVVKEYKIKENYLNEKGEPVSASTSEQITYNKQYTKNSFPTDIPSYLSREVVCSINGEKEKPVVLPFKQTVQQNMEINYIFKGKQAQFSFIRNGDSLQIDTEDLFLESSLVKEMKSVDIVVPKSVVIENYMLPNGWEKIESEGSTTFVFNQVVTESQLKDFLLSIRLRIENELPDDTAVMINFNKELVVPRDHEDGTTHYYKFVPGHFNWYEAYNLAKKENYNGLTGYLMTVTSEEEDKFISKYLTIKSGWLGGTRQVLEDGSWISDEKQISEKYQAYNHTASTWYWADGPEGIKSSQHKGFNEGALTQTPINGAYTYWFPEAPNNRKVKYPLPDGSYISEAEEDCLQRGIVNTPYWNDTSGLAKNSNQGIEGYFVEFSEYDGQKISTESNQQTKTSYVAFVPQKVKIKAYSTNKDPLPAGDITLDAGLKIGQKYDLFNQIKEITGYILLPNEIPTEKLQGVISAKEIKGELLYAPNRIQVSFFDGKDELINLRQGIAYNGKVVRPNDPKKEGFAFEKWTIDEEGKQVFDFDSPVTVTDGQLKLYAQWRPVRTEQEVNVKFIDSSQRELFTLPNLSVKVINGNQILLNDLKQQQQVKEKMEELAQLKFSLVKEPDTVININDLQNLEVVFEYQYTQTEALYLTSINSMTFKCEEGDVMTPTEIYSSNEDPITLQIKDTRNPLTTKNRGKFDLTLESSEFLSSKGKAIDGKLKHTDLSSLPGTIYHAATHRLEEDYTVVLEEKDKQKKGFKLELLPQTLDAGEYKATLTWILTPDV